MAENLDIQIRINNYIASHPKMSGKSDAVILSAMKEEGLVTQAEIDAAKTTSAFGFGFNNNINIGLSVERTGENTDDTPTPFTKEYAQERKVQAQIQNKMQEIQQSIQRRTESMWIHSMVPSHPVYESGNKIKYGNKEKSVEKFIEEDMKLNLLTEEGINTYAEILLLDQKDLKNKNMAKIGSVMQTMNLDISTEHGRKVFTRLLYLSNEDLADIDTKELETTRIFTCKGGLSFDDAADILEQQGFYIRNKEEICATQKAREKRNNRNLIATLMAATYDIQLDSLYDELQHYNDLTSGSCYANHLKEVMYKAGFTFDTPTLDVAISRAHNDKAKMEVLAQESINEELFKGNFKKCFGVEYDDDKADKLVKALQEVGSFDFNSPKVKTAIFNLLGYDVNGDFNQRKQNDEMVAGFLGTLFMVGTMGLGGELQALNQAMKGAKGAQAALQARNALGAKSAIDKFILRNITTNPVARAVFYGGLNFGVYSATTTSAQIIANLPDARLSDVNAVAEGFCQSFLFGAFAAEFGMGSNIVSGSVKNGLSKKMNMRVIKPLIEKFAKKPVMTGEELINTLLKSESTVANITAWTTNFGLEVIGFSGYEMAMTAMNGGKPDDMSFGEYLGEVLTSQFKTLGEFKIAGFMMSGRMAQARMPQETRALLRNEKLENMQIKAVNKKGKVVYVMKDLKTGKSKTYKNLADVRNRCIEIMNEPTLFDKKLKALNVGEKIELDMGSEKLVFLRTEDGIIVGSPEKIAKEEAKIRTSEALAADSFRNRVHQEINEVVVRVQTIDPKYRDAASSIKDVSTPLELFDLLDATPEEIAKFAKEHTQKIVDHKGNVMEYIVPGMYTIDEFNQKIVHLRDMREFLNQQSTLTQMTVHRLDSYSIMEQININGRKLSDIMQEAVKDGKVEDVLNLLNDSDVEVYFKNFVSATTNNDFEWYGATIKWEVNVPKNSKGVQMKALIEEKIPTEKEFILQLGSRFKIRSAEFKDGMWHIKADLVQDSEAQSENTPKTTEPKQKQFNTVKKQCIEDAQRDNPERSATPAEPAEPAKPADPTNPKKPYVSPVVKGNVSIVGEDLMTELSSTEDDLFIRPNGTRSTAAEDLMEALRNSGLERTSYGSLAEIFKDISRGYDSSTGTRVLLSDEMLNYVKELVECVPSDKDPELLIGTPGTFYFVISNLMQAKPEAQRQIIDATKELLSHPHVRNNVIEEIIKACTVGNRESGYTFDRNVFNRLLRMIDKRLPNRKYTPDFQYTLMIAELAKNAVRFETSANGDLIKTFDEINFAIGLYLPESDPNGHYIHYDITKDNATGEIRLETLNPELQNYIIQSTEQKHLQPTRTEVIQRGGYGNEETVVLPDETGKKLRNLCMVDGKLDVQNCFAVTYLIDNLGVYRYDVVKILETCKNQNGVVDMTMLRLIISERGDYFNTGILNTLKKLGQNTGILYNADGHLDQDMVKLLQDAQYVRLMSRREDVSWNRYGVNPCSFDISRHYLTDGKIDLEKLTLVEAELRDIINSLDITDMDARALCAVSNLYNAIKDNPENAVAILGMAKKCGIFALIKVSDNQGNGLNMDALKYYASLPDDLYNLIKENDWLDPFIKGDAAQSKYDLNNIHRFHLSEMTPEEKAILEKYGIDIEFIMQANTRGLIKASEVTQQAQTRFQNIIESADQIIATHDVSNGIELEYTREQFDQDILAAIKDLPEARANDILNAHGLTIRNGKVEGVIAQQSAEVPGVYFEVNNKIQECIERFNNNKVITEDPELKILYTALTSDFPEFAMLVERIGADGQRVDVTVLNQLKTLINNPQYQALSPKEQTMVKLAIIFRGFDAIDSTPRTIEKQFTISNDGVTSIVKHKRYKNSDYAAAILKRFDLTEQEKYIIADLVAHSGWSREFNNGIVDREIMCEDYVLGTNLNAQKVAVNTRFGTLNLSKLIEDVINPGNNVDVSPILEAQKKLYQNMQLINSATLEDLEPYWETRIIDGVECQVIDLRTTQLPDDFYFMAHFTQGDVRNLIGLLSNSNDKVFFSHSLVRANAASTFAGLTEGIICEFDSRNVAAAARYNIDSGFGKSYITFIRDLINVGSRDVSSHIREKLSLTKEEYGLLIEQIIDTRFEDLEEYYRINDRYISREEIIDAHQEAYEYLMKEKGEQNEITILNPRPIALIASASGRDLDYTPFKFSMANSPIRRIIIIP